MKNKNVEIQRIRYGIHSIVKVTCKRYKDETVYQGAYLATILTVDNPESEIIQQVLDDIRGIKGIDGKPHINTITMYTEDDYGERHVFFDMDDCENVLFGKEKGQAMTREERIIQANRDYQEAKRLLNVQYAERFEELPCTECGEVYAQDVLALNEWAEAEGKRILNEWANRIVHA